MMATMSGIPLRKAILQAAEIDTEDLIYDDLLIHTSLFFLVFR